MKTHALTEDGLDLNIHISGMYEHYRVDEVEIKGPDGESWCLDYDTALVANIIDEDLVEQCAYEVAYELDMEAYIDRADALYDAWKEGDLC